MYRAVFLAFCLHMLVLKCHCAAAPRESCLLPNRTRVQTQRRQPILWKVPDYRCPIHSDLKSVFAQAAPKHPSELPEDQLSEEAEEADEDMTSAVSGVKVFVDRIILEYPVAVWCALLDQNLELDEINSSGNLVSSLTQSLPLDIRTTSY